ncbi:fungal-specific transcription factor domain-containing protein [Boeremia exigua]|uniref:fungal-specific transcription factor domain-containing protein n=1 Tax=Boeremia exigua TaxID=749465 RepID=UPI001E8CF702|nr:fungal-specific transcription factor domain-containing protein [Boeremia exigua]KAH6641946.1 fungal-specific transcription factor domain-containing protein [Boeremia exigua]
MSGSGVRAGSSKRSRHTCLNCRRKKVKCHGEQPSCSFCARLLQKCVYPNQGWTTMAHRSSIFGDPEAENEIYADFALSTPRIEPQLSSASREINTAEMVPPIDWQLLADIPQILSVGQPSHTLAEGQVTASTALPPSHVLHATVDLYFELCHNQPYCFFHEATFRFQLFNGQLPQYLLLAVLAMSRRFSHDPFYENNGLHSSERYASEAWSEVVRQAFDSESGLNHRLVQAATMLAIYDFTACKHGTAWIKIGVAVSLAQALRMMTEPSPTLPFSTQEELRRTLWSIFLLDKMATCGRDRPSLFLDRTIDLQLPCNEDSFTTSTPEKVVTLENLPHLDDSEMESLRSFAPSIGLASILSQSASYAFEHNKSAGQQPPWVHTSEYQSICSRLTRFETFFDCYGDMQEHILNNEHTSHRGTKQVTESDIFAFVLYHLCYCLLHHPFLLRRRLERCGTRAPVSFLTQALESCSSHAQELTRTLANARYAGYRVSATFFSYSLLVAGSIHSLFQHSPNAVTGSRSLEALQNCMTHITEKARYWKSSLRMARALSQFSLDSARYAFLIESSAQIMSLEPADIEQLYALCDYGTMSMPSSDGLSDTGTKDAGIPGLMHAALMGERSPTVAYEEYGGHIDGIIPQMFGHHDASTMMDNFYSALGGPNGLNDATAGP